MTDESTRQALHRRLEAILKNTADAEETAQEAQLIFLRSRAAQSSRDPVPYLFRIAINLARNLLRNRKRDRVTYDTDTAELLMSAAPEATKKDAISDLLFHREQLEKIVRDMPDGPRQVLLMHFGDGLSLTDIAERLELSPATVKTYLARARAHARALQWE